MTSKKRSKKQILNLTGWGFLLPAMILISCFSLYPMINAFITSLKTGTGINLTFSGLDNYIRAFQDDVFVQSILNCLYYLIIQVPIMLLLALVLASALNDPHLKFKGFFRTCIFLPCATSLVAYAIVFRSLFATDGFINNLLIKLGILDEAFNFLANPTTAKIVIIIALVWRWTGYNMIFYLAALQNIDSSVYEAAKVDGTSRSRVFMRITVPLLSPMIAYVVITGFMGGFKEYSSIVGIFGEDMGPANDPGRLNTMVGFIYDSLPADQQGVASAAALILFGIILIITLINLQVSKKKVHY
mgnify:CR=1 FL=1